MELKITVPAGLFALVVDVDSVGGRQIQQTTAVFGFLVDYRP